MTSIETYGLPGHFRLQSCQEEIGPNQGIPVDDAMIAIGCNDGDRVPGMLEDAELYFEELVKTSEWADICARLRISCSGALRTSNRGAGGVERQSLFEFIILFGVTKQ